MPLLDHFHPPLSKQRHWDSFHGAWAEAIARYLNEDILPPHFYAEARIKIGARLEIDVATLDEAHGGVKPVDDGGIVVWAPSKAASRFGPSPSRSVRRCQRCRSGSPPIWPCR